MRTRRVYRRPPAPATASSRTAIRSKPAVELQSVPVRIEDVELARAPGGVRRRVVGAAAGRLFGEGAAVAQLGVEVVDVTYAEAVGRPVDRVCPVPRVLPLQEKLDAVARHSRVLRVDGAVLEGHGEAEALVETGRG